MKAGGARSARRRAEGDLPPPLSAQARARGRRLAIASHPAGMVFRTAFTQFLPTLALVALGANEFWVGLQNAFLFAFIGLQLPTLAAVGRVSKRAILVAGHSFALLAAVPLLFFRHFDALAGGGALALALVSFGLCAAGIVVSDTVWFSLLRSYVESDRVGRFFGTLRTGWHLTLIVFFTGSQAWLARHPGDFAPLFGVAWALGLARIALISRLPERSERAGRRIRLRELLDLARDPRLRRYLVGVAWGNAARHTTIPFAIVMLRREVGFTEAQVLAATVAAFCGGLASLYAWGRAVDRLGAAPVFQVSAVGLGLLLLVLTGVGAAGPLATTAAMVAWFFAHAALAAGFGVADTHTLFDLAPPEAPVRTLVLGAVAVGIAGGTAPILAGLALDALIPAAGEGLGVYHGFFAVLGVLQAGAFLPLRRFRAGSS